MGTVSWLTNKKEQLNSSCSVAKKRRTRFRFGEYNFINTLKDVTLSPEVAETSLCVSVSSVCGLTLVGEFVAKPLYSQLNLNISTEFIYNNFLVCNMNVY